MHEYLVAKEKKLENQNKEASSQKSNIFTGLSFILNGKMEPRQEDMKQMIIDNGGKIMMYWRKGPQSYMVCCALPTGKQAKLTKNDLIVHPNFVIDSIHCNMLLDSFPYRLYHMDKGQNSILTEDVMSPINEATHEDTQFSIENTQSQNNDDDIQTQTTQSTQTITPNASTIDIKDPNFLDAYYQNSRLHHLSKWREDLKIWTSTLSFPNRTKNGSYSVLHVDMDCFFVSCSLVASGRWEELNTKPVAIGYGSSSTSNDSSSDLASCNYAARKLGVKNGMFSRSALELAPNLIILPYDFAEYERVSYALYSILSTYADVHLEAVSCDEAYLYCSNVADDASKNNNVSITEIAKKIKSEIFQKTGCPASIGIGYNCLSARIATKRAKPDGIFSILERKDFISLIREEPLTILPGIGRMLKEKLCMNGLAKCGDVGDLQSLQGILGAKMGQKVWEMVKDGGSASSTTKIPPLTQRKSIGNDVTWAVRFEEETDVLTFIERLSERVFKRQEDLSLSGTKIQVKVMRRREGEGESIKRMGHGICDNFSKSKTVGKITELSLFVGNVIAIYKEFKIPPEDLRGIGIFIMDFRASSSSSSGSGDIRKMMVFNSKPKKKRDKEGIIEKRGYDPEVFSALPLDIQEEVLRMGDVPDDFRKKVQRSERSIVSIIPNSLLPPFCELNRLEDIMDYLQKRLSGEVLEDGEDLEILKIEIYEYILTLILKEDSYHLEGMSRIIRLLKKYSTSQDNDGLEVIQEIARERYGGDIV